MPTFLQNLDPKDWITLIASMSAFTFSLLGYWQRSAEGKIAMRKQLTDTLQKLTDINQDVARYRALSAERRDGEYPPNYVHLLNDQRRFLARQAEFLSRRIQRMLSPYEHLLIATAFDAVDDTVRAEQFFTLGCQTEEPLDRNIALRNFARYYFNRGQREAAREKYLESLRAMAAEADHFRVYRADTYERWAVQERECGNESECRRLLGCAVEEYSHLSSGPRRDHDIRRVQKQIGALGPAAENGSQTAPV